MNDRQKQILRDLDAKGRRHYCLQTGRNLVGRVDANLDGKRLSVAITRTKFGYFAAVEFDGLVQSVWEKTPSDAVIQLGRSLREKSN